MYDITLFNKHIIQKHCLLNVIIYNNIGLLLSPITICLSSLNIHLHHSLWNTWTVMALYYGALLTLSDVLFSLCFCRYVGCFCHYVVCFCRYVGCFCCYLGCFCCDVGCIMTITLLY